MSGTFEREIKLRVASAADARTAVTALGATPLRPRRLQQDAILDFADARLRDARCALRVRREPGTCAVTFKGAPQPSLMKLREELETSAADADIVLAIFERLGLRAWFRSEKYREEFALHDVIIAIDDTPIGTFIEIEGSEAGIARTAEALGRGTSDYIVESYRTLYVQQRTAAGLEAGDMRFPS